MNEDPLNIISRNIMTINSVLMLVHQIRISDALQDLRDVLARKKR
jgi:hypothetical protein